MRTGTGHPEVSAGQRKLRGAFRTVSRRILESANSQSPRPDFLREILNILLEYSGCDGVGLVLRYRGRDSRSRLRRYPGESFDFRESPLLLTPGTEFTWTSRQHQTLERLCRNVVGRDIRMPKKYFSPAGSFWCSDAPKCSLVDWSEIGDTKTGAGIEPNSKVMSWVLIPIGAGSDCTGLMSFESLSSSFFLRHQISLLEQLIQAFGVALTHRQLQLELRERIKELTCLYDIAKLATKPGISLDEILGEATELLPPGWLYPEAAEARITVDESTFSTAGFEQALASMKSDIVISGKSRGRVEVGYTTETPDLDEGPFLREERHLLEAVAGEISKIVEQNQMQSEKERLQEQLRHADRLATIGQLAAGVAHELNEPLASILGFAQLCQKSDELKSQTRQDLDKIAAAALHAREVIRKLLVFAREKPTDQSRISLNDVVSNGLYFLESRCAGAGIEVEMELAEHAPEVIAAQSQLVQILTNLVVNSIQAMPDGGRLTVSTGTQADCATLSVTDTGTGMSREVQENMFNPFFTTKSDDQGTGLGLSVVHGIISSLGGKIDVETALDSGTKMIVTFPPVDESQKE